MAIHLQQGMLRHYAKYAHFDPDAILQLLDQTSFVLYICTNGLKNWSYFIVILMEQPNAGLCAV